MGKEILELLTNIRGNLGMSGDYFYYTVTIIVLPAVSFLHNRIFSAHTAIENYWFDLKSEQKEDTILLKAISFWTVVSLFEAVPVIIINAILQNFFPKVTVNIVTVICLTTIMFFGIHFFLRQKFIRKEFLESKKKKILCTFILLLNFLLASQMCGIGESYMLIILFVFVLLYEIYGLFFVFNRTYTIYQYKNVKLYLLNGSVLDWKDVSK